jgi:hypothetical protein
MLCADYVKQVNELAILRERGRASGRDPEFADLTRRLGFVQRHDPPRVLLLQSSIRGLPRTRGSPRPCLRPSGLSRSSRRISLLSEGCRESAGSSCARMPSRIVSPTTGSPSTREGVPAGFKPLLVRDVWEHALVAINLRAGFLATEGGVEFPLILLAALPASLNAGIMGLKRDLVLCTDCQGRSAPLVRTHYLTATFSW